MSDRLCGQLLFWGIQLEIKEGSNNSECVVDIKKSEVRIELFIEALKDRQTYAMMGL